MTEVFSDLDFEWERTSVVWGEGTLLTTLTSSDYHRELIANRCFKQESAFSVRVPQCWFSGEFRISDDMSGLSTIGSTKLLFQLLKTISLAIKFAQRREYLIQKLYVSINLLQLRRVSVFFRELSVDRRNSISKVSRRNP